MLSQSDALFTITKARAAGVMRKYEFSLNHKCDLKSRQNGKSDTKNK